MLLILFTDIAGKKQTVIFADKLMDLGFQEACKAGISFGKDDLIIPENKKRIIGTNF